MSFLTVNNKPLPLQPDYSCFRMLLAGAYWTPQTPRYVWGWWMKSGLDFAILSTFSYIFLPYYRLTMCFVTLCSPNLVLTKQFNTPLATCYLSFLLMRPFWRDYEKRCLRRSNHQYPDSSIRQIRLCSSQFWC